MAVQPQLNIIEQNPIANSLEGFRTSYQSVCRSKRVPCTLDALDQLDLEDVQNLALDLLSALQTLRTSRLLHSAGSGKDLFGDLLRLTSSVYSNNFDLDRIRPLLEAALVDDLNDTLIWDRVYDAVIESTPLPRPIASSSKQTPWRHSTSSFANSSEYRQDVDKILKLELGPLYVGVSRFRETYFGGVAGLEAAANAVFDKCTQDSNPLFRGGWRGWPTDANQDAVLVWFADLSEKLASLGDEHMPIPRRGRRPLAQPNQPIQGSTAERKLDIGFVDNAEASVNSRCHWSQILIPGELKRNPSADVASKAHLDIGRYAREVLTAQDTRRFVLGFTLCGSRMRIWEFDRLGGIASDQFDINQDGLQLVSTVLGFLWMNEEELGFDPTITRREDGQRLVTINRNGLTERLIIDKIMKRASCVAGRATTCWRAHREEDPQATFVIKDSWQYTERDEEGELLRDAADKGVVNVARYYHHETVRVRGEVDDIRSNVRGGMDITQAKHYRSETKANAPRKGYSSSAGLKRASSETDAALPPSKRRSAASLTKAGSGELPNRVHRRVIVRDFGRSIYTASSRSALLAALVGCIEGHESLHTAGLLHRDISINNLMINEDKDNPSWPSFLIDLDLAIREQREGASGAKGKTGTRAFMAIGALLDEQHSFMHDLESFFWVLFWICIHCNGPDESRVVPEFDTWNYISTERLAKEKLGTVAKESIFVKTITDNFTPYYAPLIPLLNKLRKVVFPQDKPCEREDKQLYARMRDILQKGGRTVAAEGGEERGA
ncbi:hypothetical protein BT67DRAFT_378402 [Trichocladium antarcticum]|uniref:non-specific serine/threonine protein kinase n=1 Tax=Trichocladium antarcticum TaxID=1450529 RepID=A0AAN6UL21_9PEZI|nr:hypothetical protein BT67DRAFT_378402 [Trichocladium antarcticum]